ncbi:MAG TPA: hypothetical protein PLV55_06090 [Anaerohalosphaeraceae bacterium]|nr:hypothetical protein [Anaerohalosphaeraceae bacterium]
MGSLIKKPKTQKPVVTAPAPTTETIRETEETETRRAAARSGYRKTILAGSLAPSSGKKTTLG